MMWHSEIDEKLLWRHIRKKLICFGGNKKLKIYGSLNCASGKRMKKTNRVFFVSEIEAINNGYRPCGHCLRTAYKIWKDGII